MKKSLLFFCCLVLAMIITYPTNSKAYVLNNQNVCYNPQYTNLSSANAYLPHLKNAEKWTYTGGKVFLSEYTGSGTVNIYQGFVDTDNGTYGVCYYNTSRESDIRYYRLFKNASPAVRNETVVHEVGHAIGLRHTQTVNDANAVMREFGFNNIAAPLSDDKAGINAKY